MSNVDRMGLCRGTFYEKGKPPKRCFRPGYHKHMTPKLDEYFLCDICEEHIMGLLNRGEDKAVNQYIAGGSRTTGVGYVRTNLRHTSKDSPRDNDARRGVVRINVGKRLK